MDVPFPWGGGSWGAGPRLGTDTLWSTAGNGTGAVIVEQSAPRRPGVQEVRVLRLALTGDTVFHAAVRVPVLATTAAWREAQD